MEILKRLWGDIQQQSQQLSCLLFAGQRRLRVWWSQQRDWLVQSQSGCHRNWNPRLMFPTDRWLPTLPPARSSLTLESQTRDGSQMRCNWKTGLTGSPTAPSMTPTRKRKNKYLANISVFRNKLHWCCSTSPAVWTLTIVVVTRLLGKSWKGFSNWQRKLNKKKTRSGWRHFFVC